MKDNLSWRLLVVCFIGLGCFAASALVLGLVVERQGRAQEAQKEVADKWGRHETFVGPIVVVSGESSVFYILPESVNYESVLQPETRSRGIFETIVYSANIKASGEFFTADIVEAIRKTGKNANFNVSITDTRGIEGQPKLSWNNKSLSFEPGSGLEIQEGTGLHVVVPVDSSLQRVPFTFEVRLKGSGGIAFAPIGKETTLTVSSPWQTPSFMGAFLPSSREIGASGFNAEWKISSFGRSYPQMWTDANVDLQKVVDSSAGVELHEQVDLYAKIFRSIKYAILFILITFASFFLFEVLSEVRIHPMQYFFIGSALALFYLLLLSLAEQVGFPVAYTVAASMTAGLIATYSSYTLHSKQRTFSILGMLVALYGYLYFVLILEDYALLFGSLLIFVLLGTTMYLTRNLDWFKLSQKN